MSSKPAPVQDSFRFGDDFEFDFTAYQLRRAGRVLKLERIPVEILRLLVERRGEVVTREQIVEKIWGKDIFLDTDNSINGAIRKIRQTLRDDPEQPRFIQTVTGKGYRFIAPVAAAEPVRVTELPMPAPEIRTQKSAYPKWPLAFGVIVVFAALLGGYFQWRGPGAGRQVSAPKPMLAVLPFQNLTGDASQDYFSDGLTEEMVTQLGSLDPEHFGVIARTSVMHYKGTQAPLTQIGHELGVQYVIEGSVRRNAERVRISAQLIQVKDQSHVWAHQYDRELKDVLAVQSEIAQQIASRIRLTLGDPRGITAAHHPAPSSYEAYDFYLRGLYFWNKRTDEGFHQAAYYFQQAINKDPNYARAYAGLANTFGLMSTYSQGDPNVLMPKAHATASRALEIDETSAEAHTALALIAESYDYDWQRAEKEFRRALELDPGYATAHQWYAEHLAWRGRFDQALAESERARQLDPLSLIIASDNAVILFYARQYDRAIVQLRAVLEMDPSFGHPIGALFGSYVQTGRFTEALELWRDDTSENSPWRWAGLVYLYGKWGRTEDAQHALAKLEQVTPHSRSDMTRARIIAYVSAGRNDQAVVLLRKACAEHSNFVTDLKVNPVYDPLRGDPRFQDMLKRVGLAQ